MKVVTVADKWPKEDYYLHREFLESLKRFGHEPLILGFGTGEYNGLGSKPRILMKALKEGRIPGDRIIFCDSFDVVFAAPPEAINSAAIENYGAGIVWNAERNCFPDASLANKHQIARSSFRYLNSGFAVGGINDFLDMLEWMGADTIPGDHRSPDGSMVHPNDQDYIMRALISGVGMSLDDKCQLCQTLCGVTMDEFEISDRGIMNRETGSFPMAFHFNGPAKTNGTADPILSKLGLR